MSAKASRPGHYFALGKQCIDRLLQALPSFQPGKTLGLEERIEMKLKDGDKTYSVQGYIDRLTWVPETETYEIHDYKTGGDGSHAGRRRSRPAARPLPARHHAALAGRQEHQADLALSGRRQRNRLLAHAKRIWPPLNAKSSRSSTGSKTETKLGRWDVRVSRLCDWCEYKPICPAWKHPIAMEVLAPNEYLQDTGVQLVQKYAELEARKADLQAEIKVTGGGTIQNRRSGVAWAQKENCRHHRWPGASALFNNEEEFKAPTKSEDPFAWELLRTTLKNAGKLEDVSTVNSAMLKFAIKKNKWPADLVKSILGLVTTQMKKTDLAGEKDIVNEQARPHYF